MKVVVLAAAYPSPAEPERALFIESLTRELASGPDTTVASVVAPWVHPGDPRLEVRQGIRVRRFPTATGGRRLKEIERPGPLLLAAHALSAASALLSEVRSSRADLILAHWILPSGPIAAMVSRLLRVPCVLVAHGSDVHRYAQGRGVLHRAARWAVRRSSRVVAVSRELRSVLVSHLGAVEARAPVIPMGADAAHFPFPPVPRSPADRALLRQKLGVPGDAPLLLFVGDWIEAKGVLDLIEALRALRRDGIAFAAAFAGAGPLEEALRPAARELGLLLPGRLPQAEVARWMRAADLFVLPSHSEGTPVSILEALASGTAVLATRVGGIPEVVEEGSNGWLVPPGDPRALSAALASVLGDPRRLEEARARIERSSEDLTAGRRARELRRVLEEVLRGA